MRISIEMSIDIRNYLYLLCEQGADTTALQERLSELEERVEKEQRGESREWRELEREVYELAQSWTTDEPSDLEAIRTARPQQRIDALPGALDDATVRDKVGGGWYGRIAGCILGKPVECLMKEKDSRAALRKLLDESGEYPIRDFISEKTILPYWESLGTAPSWFTPGSGNPSLREYLRFAPADDDLNYTVLSLDVLERHGREFSPDQLLDSWIALLSYNSVCTAEKLAYRNRVMGLGWPETATFVNPYGEWIGAQIRADAYGYVCPMRPEEAAAMAWADAASSHVKNGIYGAMWVAAAIAAAYGESDPKAIVARGLEQVPATCRFTEHVRRTVAVAERNGDDFEATFDDINQRLGEYHCVHTINNACVVAAALIHGGHDLGRVISIAVMGGLDTDCNGATAGSIAGVMVGETAIAPQWKDPFNDTLYTAVRGRSEQRISALIDETVKRID
ncbi:MAG: ADP-ribosylglycohydrolase family protein [Chitinivibrionales bacterium]|nr:ADP-ribosylglycohydrolase family protein [Chitinivibrionales bacterium]